MSQMCSFVYALFSVQSNVAYGNYDIGVVAKHLKIILTAMNVD